MKWILALCLAAFAGEAQAGWGTRVCTVVQSNTCCEAADCSKCSVEVTTIRIVNRHRVRYGLRPLRRRAYLINGCRRHSRRQYLRGHMHHGALNGCSAENVAHGQSSPEEVVSSWMGSSGHRANILNPSFSEVGVAVEGDYWTQQFN